MFNDLNFIWKNIRAFRRSRNRSPAQPASKIGIWKGPPGRIKRGDNLPSATVILNIPSNVLFAPDHQPPRGSARHFIATFLMPDTPVLTSVVQQGITLDTYTWNLVLRIKHRFGISTKAFVYRLKALNLITEEATNPNIQKIRTHYKQTGFG